LKIINSLSEAILAVAMGVVLILMLLTVSDVFFRYTFANPITGTMEMTEFIMICLLICMAPCTLAGKHVRVDALVQRLRPRVQAILEIVLYIPGLAMVAIIAWRGFEYSKTVLEFGARSSMLDIPNYPFFLVLIISFILMFFAMLVLFVQSIMRAIKG